MVREKIMIQNAEEFITKFYEGYSFGLMELPNPEMKADIFELAKFRYTVKNENGYLYGLCLFSGFGCQPSQKEGLEVFESLAKEDCPKALYKLGFCYLNGVGYTQNRVNGFNFMLRAAKLNNPLSYRIVGDCYAQGIGVKENYKEALFWYKKATDLGDAQAEKSYFEIYQLANIPREREPEKPVVKAEPIIKEEPVQPIIEEKPVEPTITETPSVEEYVAPAPTVEEVKPAEILNEPVFDSEVIKEELPATDSTPVEEETPVAYDEPIEQMAVTEEDVPSDLMEGEVMESSGDFYTEPKDANFGVSAPVEPIEDIGAKKKKKKWFSK